MDPKTNGVQSDKDGVQGEGNYDATRRYEEGLKKSVDKGNADDLAEKAKQALAGAEGEELRKADEKGKAGEPGTPDKHGANKPVPE